MLFSVFVLFVPFLMAVDPAVIINSGSTNTAGFLIQVSPSGEAVYTLHPRRGGPPSEEPAKPVTRQLPSAVVKRFFDALEAGKPLASLPHQRCMKSVSFGSTLVVEYGDQKTPDLSCGNQQDSRTKALAQSANEIVTQFNTH
jgi:hypothetical protein